MLNKTGKAKLKELKANYDLSTDRAMGIAEVIAKQADIVTDAEGIIAKEGLVVTAGKNGTPYQHPAVGIRNKAIELAVQLEDKLTELGGRKDDKGGAEFEVD